MITHKRRRTVPGAPSDSETLSEEPERTSRRLHSVAEVADMFGRAPRTVRSWIARGLIRQIKVGNSVFIPEEQIDALLRGEVRKLPGCPSTTIDVFDQSFVAYSKTTSK